MKWRHARRLGSLPAAQWDALFDAAYPFTRHAWLSALETHGCVAESAGWEPLHLIGEDEAGQIVAAAPLYLKHHSYGEFVFDFHWAEASHRLGRPYYPKLLCAIPFVPATGPRLGAADAPRRHALARHLASLADSTGRSSVHLLFTTDVDADALAKEGLIERNDTQFQWRNPGYDGMRGFLDQLASDKRKKLLRERRRVIEAGIGFEWARGRELSDREWDHVHALYANTYHERGQAPYFSRDFLADVGRNPALDLRLVFAVHDGRRVAVAISLVGGDTLYGRHWGTEAHYHSLHFECCYYQGIELCLREGLRRFDAGTQGAHKHARGFEPVRTRSLHRMADPRLQAAVADYLSRERSAVAARAAEFMHHTPYRADRSDAVR